MSRLPTTRVDPQTHAVRQTTTAVQSLLSADGIRFMLTSMVRNFSNFGPVGIIFVVMVGVGLAEQAGLMTALIKKIVQVTPRWAVTWILVTLGVMSSVASDAGYLVLIPLGAAAFLEPRAASAGRSCGGVCRCRRRVRCQHTDRPDRWHPDRNHQ